MRIPPSRDREGITSDKGCPNHLVRGANRFSVYAPVVSMVALEPSKLAV